jgi:hypothetical protein
MMLESGNSRTGKAIASAVASIATIRFHIHKPKKASTIWYRGGEGAVIARLIRIVKRFAELKFEQRLGEDCLGKFVLSRKT